MFAYNRDNICKWKVSEGFGQIFGKSAGVNIKDAECVAPANIDAIFENFIIIDHERYINIDYEWTFDFPVPIDFIKYRTLLYFSQIIEVRCKMLSIRTIFKKIWN